MQIKILTLPAFNSDVMEEEGITDIIYQRIGRRPSSAFEVFLTLLDDYLTDTLHAHTQRIIHIKDNILNTAGNPFAVTHQEEKDIGIEHVAHKLQLKAKSGEKMMLP